MRCSRLTPKASVLPVPVRAWPIMSVPATAIGIASDWIGKGCTMPSLARASVISGMTPRSPNVCSESTAGTVWVVVSVRVMPYLLLQPATAQTYRTAGGARSAAQGRHAQLMCCGDSLACPDLRACSGCGGSGDHTVPKPTGRVFSWPRSM